MNNLLIQTISQFLSILRQDLEIIKQNPKFQNCSIFVDRMTPMLTSWETVIKKEGMTTSERNRIIREIVENSNELFLIKHLLENEPNIVKLEYEKPLQYTPKTIDLYIEIENGNRLFLDVKTIQPENIDAWDKYVQMKQHLHGNIHLEREGLGGEFWHKMFAARSKMLEYSLELENKIPQDKCFDGAFMVFCSNGFDWHLDELEDFADSYNYKKYREDDFFKNIEQHYINDKEILMKRNISGFCYFEREHFESSEMQFVFNVKGPISPWQKSNH